MRRTSKTKGIIIIIIFIAILVLPVTYVLIKEYFNRHTEVKQAIPNAQPVDSSKTK